MEENFRVLFSQSKACSDRMLKPKLLLEEWQHAGLQESMPSLFDMIKWIVDINVSTGEKGISFDEFMHQCVFFFS